MPRGPINPFRHLGLHTALHSLRTEKEVTQRIIAERVRLRGGTLTPEYYSEIERGRKKPSIDLLAHILHALNITPKQLECALPTLSGGYPRSISSKELEEDCVQLCEYYNKEVAQTRDINAMFSRLNVPQQNALLTLLDSFT